MDVLGAGKQFPMAVEGQASDAGGGGVVEEFRGMGWAEFVMFMSQLT